MATNVLTDNEPTQSPELTLPSLDLQIGEALVQARVQADTTLVSSGPIAIPYYLGNVADVVDSATDEGNLPGSNYESDSEIHSY